MSSTKIRKLSGGAALLAAGLVAGGVLAGSLTAGAAETTSPSTSASSSSTAGNAAETPLTGTKLDKVKTAVLAKYPSATFDRVETDSDGVYEAHITRADGAEITVALDADYAITGEETGHGGQGGHGGGAGETALTGDTLAQVKAAVTKA
jgi:hypothetical protein